jgi:hypothetical protein
MQKEELIQTYKERMAATSFADQENWLILLALEESIAKLRAGEAPAKVEEFIAAVEVYEQSIKLSPVDRPAWVTAVHIHVHAGESRWFGDRYPEVAEHVFHVVKKHTETQRNKMGVEWFGSLTPYHRAHIRDKYSLNGSTQAVPDQKLGEIYEKEMRAAENVVKSEGAKKQAPPTSPYQMAINNTATFIRSQENKRAATVGTGLDAFAASFTLGVAFCKAMEEVLADLIKAQTEL